jgi:RecA/RadA recombinase
MARQIAMTTPYITPGGKAMHYSYSLRIWLTGRKSKAAYVLDSKGYRIGSEVKVKLEKSRFGTQGRNCVFRILWGTESIGVQDEESWIDAIKNSKHMSISGSWYTFTLGDYTKKFQPSKWVSLIKGDPEFKQKIIELMDIEVVEKFHKREGDAQDFYDIDGEESAAK